MEDREGAQHWARGFNNGKWSGAGVLPYAYRTRPDGETEAVALLWLKKNGLLDEFGGARNKEIDPRDTAAREFEEESYGALYSAEELKQQFFDYDRGEDNPPGSSLLFSAFYLECWIPYDPEAGERYQLRKAEKLGPDSKKTSLHWVPFKTIRAAIQPVLTKSIPKKGIGIVLEGGENVVLRRHFTKMMVTAEKIGLLGQVAEARERIETIPLSELLR